MRVLVAGVGNVLLGDDGFGVELARRLARRGLPGGVRVVDFGIRGLDLTYALLDGYDGAIVVDACRRGGAPGTLYVLEPTMNESADAAVDTHAMHPARVLAAMKAMGGAVEWLRLVGCEPGPLPDDDELAMGLSAPVEAAVEPAIGLVERLLAEVLAREVARA
jgi:hydrogenase maturation protease